MLRPILIVTRAVCLALIGIIVVAIGLPRLAGLTPLQTRLAACESPCTWEMIDAHAMRVGDVLVALGAPLGISIIAPTANQKPNPPFFRELIFYPARGLTVTIDNRDDPARLTARTTHDLSLITSASPAMWLPWRGFAKLCRYYPGVWPLCVIVTP